MRANRETEEKEVTQGCPCGSEQSEKEEGCENTDYDQS